MAQKCGRLPWEGSPALGAGCTSHGSQWCQIPHCAIQCPWCAGSNVSVCLLGTTLFLRMPCPGALKSPAVPLPGKKFFLASLRRVLFLFEIFFQLRACVVCVEGECTRVHWITCVELSAQVMGAGSLLPPCVYWVVQVVRLEARAFIHCTI